MAWKSDKTVLVAVLKDKRDREILLREKWYRIPLDHLPRRKFEYIAFYQPVGLGTHGKRIEHYARITDTGMYPRAELLPEELDHPRAGQDYVKLSFDKIEILEQPIMNVIPRRVSFGFTTLEKLLTSSDMLQLYGVRKTEQIIQRRLERLGIVVRPEFTIMVKDLNTGKPRRFRIDLAIFCLNGKIAVECDNRKAHSGKLQSARDRDKDAHLALDGWQVIRLTEEDIIKRPNECVARIQKIVTDF